LLNKTVSLLLKSHPTEEVYVIYDVKGIVHFKMKCLPSFTHPQVVSNRYDFFFRWTQKIYWRMSVSKQLTGPIDFHSRKKNTMEVNEKKYYGSQWV